MTASSGPGMDALGFEGRGGGDTISVVGFDAGMV